MAGNGRGNCSNVFRIFAAIKRGDVVDIDSTNIEQVSLFPSAYKMYVINVTTRSVNTFRASGPTGDRWRSSTLASLEMAVQTTSTRFTRFVLEDGLVHKGCANSRTSIAVAISETLRMRSGSMVSAVAPVSSMRSRWSSQGLTRADVVTAVADLLHEFGALVYDEDFDKTYATIVTLYKSLQKGHGMENQGKVRGCCSALDKPKIDSILALLHTVSRTL